MVDVVKKIKDDKCKIESFFKDLIKVGLSELVNKMDHLIGFWEAPLEEMKEHIASLRRMFGELFAEFVLVFS